MNTLTQYFRANKRLLEIIVIVLVLISAIIIGFETDDSVVQQYGYWLDGIDKFIISFFVIEVLIQIFFIYDKPINYFKSAWNWFDLGIILVCALPYFISAGDLHTFSILRLFRLARTIRVLRVFRLVTQLRPLQVLVEALIKSLPSMGYVALLLGMIFFIYGVIGVHFFKEFDKVHFGSLPLAILTLFKVVTGAENWSQVMEVELKSMPVVPLIYFISFFIIAGLVMLNLFVGVLISELTKVETEILAEQNKSSDEHLLEEIKKLLSKR